MAFTFVQHPEQIVKEGHRQAAVSHLVKADTIADPGARLVTDVDAGAQAHPG